MSILFKRVGWVFVALALILGFGTTAPAVADEMPTGDHGTPSMSEAEFVAGAIEVAGLTASEARAAYVDPEVAATVPVKVVTHVSDTAGPSRNADSTAAESISVDGSCEVTGWRRWQNAFGGEIMRFTIDKYFEYDGSTVGNWDGSYYGSVTDLGSFNGWVYDGVGSRTNNYRNDQMSHYTQASGAFSNSINGDGWTAAVEVLVHADGSYEISWPGLEQDPILGQC